jgi:formate hydrogenlyase subunit 4
MNVLNTVLHIVFLFLFAPLLLGVIQKTKAWFAGRRGAPFLQLYYDLFKLARKDMVISTTTSWIFRVGPWVGLVSVAMAGFLVPFGNFNAPVSFEGDMILFVYLLAVNRFFTTTAALDTGSAFEGMGASRELTFAFLTEPTIFLAFLMLGKVSQTLTLTGFLTAPVLGYTSSLVAPLVLVSLGLFLVLLAESSRIPVDDPDTHLELTMIHEVMVLDNSGPLLGAIQYASSMKFLILGAILLHTAVPFAWGSALPDGLLFTAELLALAVVVGVVESSFARLRLKRVPLFLTGALLACGASFLLVMR